MKMKIEPNLRQKTLLIFLGAGDAKELDPIRIMKGLFIFTMEAPKEWLSPSDRYNFVPYDYGPCSSQIYSDLDLLKEKRYIKSIEKLGFSWKYYSLTPEGTKLMKKLIKDIDRRIVKYLQKIRDFVYKLSFRELLGAVYDKYPEYAVNSIFKFH